MTKPIPQRNPMLALPEPKAIFIPELNILFTNIRTKSPEERQKEFDTSVSIIREIFDKAQEQKDRLLEELGAPKTRRTGKWTELINYEKQVF